MYHREKNPAKGKCYCQPFLLLFSISLALGSDGGRRNQSGEGKTDVKAVFLFKTEEKEWRGEKNPEKRRAL
jgi:hypothetical protein